MGSNSEHILLVPYMARGHLIPFLELAIRIHQSTGFVVTILNTPLNIKYLRSKLHGNEDAAITANIRLVELPFCSSDHGLPPNVESTRSLSLHQVIDLFHASATLEPAVREFIKDQVVAKEGRPPLCIVSDVFCGWAVDVARSFGSVGVTFSTGGAYGTAAYTSIWKDLPHRHSATQDGYFTPPGFPESHQFHITQLHKFLRAADGTDRWSAFFQPQISLAMSSDGWLLNTVDEVEPLGMSIIRNYLKVPVWPIGPLLPPEMLSHKPVKSEPNEKDECIQWLDQNSQDSVLYISFGSQNSITPTQMMQLAMGLEESAKRFLWVIRPPFGFNPDEDFKDEWLPLGFEERMRENNQGILVKKWAPQMEILSHGSTGAFLSHCGWNSILESLSQGVPIIGWPLAAEQSYNSKMLVEEMGVSVELTRGLEGGLTKEEVKRVVELVMDRKGKGRELKRAAVEISKKLAMAIREEAIQEGSSVKAMDDFVDTVLSLRSQIHT
ncbi:UDP-glycosyltransferase 92A1-like protein [Drosera capensis]